MIQNVAEAHHGVSSDADVTGVSAGTDGWGSGTTGMSLWLRAATTMVAWPDLTFVLDGSDTRRCSYDAEPTTLNSAGSTTRP